MSALFNDLQRWTRETIRQTLGAPALAALDRDVAVPAEMASRNDDAVALLTRLLWIGEEISTAQLHIALPHTLAAFEPEQIGWLSKTASGWRSKLQIVPVAIPPHLTLAGEHAGRKTAWIASSPGQMQGARHGEDFVMGVGGATRTLAALASYGTGQHVLDLGTGSAIHAILAAMCGAQVVATDIAEGALELARFNAELNGVSLDLRRGSLYQPVAGERFDVVVSNPPFVITPASAREPLGTLHYRDGGGQADALVAKVVGELADHLEPGGEAWMLVNWEAGEQAVGEQVAAWARGLDTHLVQRDLLPVTSYIEMWLRDGGLAPRDPDYADGYERWLTDFQRRGVAQIGLGYLHAKPGTGKWLAQELLGPTPANLHEYMYDAWAAWHSVPASHGAGLSAPETVRELAKLVPSATNVAEHRFYKPGSEDPFLIKFTQTAGFGQEVVADTALAAFMSVADGELSTSQIVQALGQLLDVDSGSLLDELAPKLVELASLGMLTFGSYKSTTRERNE